MRNGALPLCPFSDFTHLAETVVYSVFVGMATPSDNLYPTGPGITTDRDGTGMITQGQTVHASAY